MANTLKHPSLLLRSQAGQFVKMVCVHYLAFQVCLLGMGVVRILVEVTIFCNVL